MAQSNFNNLNRSFRQYKTATELYEDLLELTKPGGDFTVRNFVGVIEDMSVKAATVSTPLFPLAALEYYSKKNLNEPFSKDEEKAYQEEERGGHQGDYSSGMTLKIRNAVECLREHPESKRAVIPIPFSDCTSTNVNYKDQGQTKCVRELYLYIEDGKLKCTGILRMQNAVIFPKNIHFIACLLKKVAAELGVEVGEYTHFITSLCRDRTAKHY